MSGSGCGNVVVGAVMKVSCNGSGYVADSRDVMLLMREIKSGVDKDSGAKR